MKYLQGFRTIIFNVVTILAAWLTVNYDIELTEEHQLAITTTIISIGNIALRLVTKTPVGRKDNTVDYNEDKKEDSKNEQTEKQ